MACEVWALKDSIPYLENLKETGLVTSWCVSNPCSEQFQTEKFSAKVRLHFLNVSHSDCVCLQHCTPTLCTILHQQYAARKSFSCEKILQCALNFHCQEAAGYAGCKALLNTLIWKIKQLQWPEAMYPSRDLQCYTDFVFCFLRTFLALQNCFQLTSLIFRTYYSLFSPHCFCLSHASGSSKRFLCNITLLTRD